MSDKEQEIVENLEHLKVKIDGNRRWAMFALKIAIVGAAIGMVGVGLSLWALAEVIG